MLGQTFRTPSRGERLARNPVKAVLAPLSFPARRGGGVRLPLGAMIYPISIALVAAATVGVFFGLGFCLMVQRPAAGAYGEAQAASSAATPIPADATRPPATPATALPAARRPHRRATPVKCAGGRRSSPRAYHPQSSARHPPASLIGRPDQRSRPWPGWRRPTPQPPSRRRSPRQRRRRSFKRRARTSPQLRSARSWRMATPLFAKATLPQRASFFSVLRTLGMGGGRWGWAPLTIRPSFASARFAFCTAIRPRRVHGICTPSCSARPAPSGG